MKTVLLARLGALAAALDSDPAVPWQPGPERYSVTIPGSPGPTVSLYPPGGVVGVSTGKSLREALNDPEDGGRNWYFIELYDHMCPHCWYTVPIVTDVASAYLGNPTWRMTSLNCHMRTNAEVCFFLEIISGAMDYPTFLLCPPQGSKPIVDEETVRSLPQRAQGLLQHLAGSQRTAFMELLRCRVRYIEDEAGKGKEDPFLSSKIVATWVTHVTGLQVVHEKMLSMGADFTDRSAPDPAAPPGRPGWLADDKAGAPGVPRWVPPNRWRDGLRGFVALLHQGYREDRHQAAVDSAWFLARAFPIKGRELADLAERLMQQGPIKDLMKFRKFLGSWARSAYIPLSDGEEETYMTCDGSSCAMWTLLHVTLTAVAARGISGRTLLGDASLAADGSADDLVGIQQAVDFVKTFVTGFLSCHQCKVNFLRDFDHCKFGRCEIQDFRDLPLWLWRLHNAISLRVAQHSHAFVDRRWPMYEDCPTCWRKTLVMGGMQSGRRLAQPLTTQLLDSPYHTDRIFWHMVRTYIGVQRVAFELSDLTRDEQEEVEAVLERERAIAAGKPVPRQPEPQHQEEESHPLMWKIRKFLMMLSFIILASGILGVLIFNQCDLSRVGQLFGATEYRTTRAPVIRDPQAHAGAAQDEEDDLVEDGGSFRAEESARDNDPAAE